MPRLSQSIPRALSLILAFSATGFGILVVGLVIRMARVHNSWKPTRAIVESITFSRIGDNQHGYVQIDFRYESQAGDKFTHAGRALLPGSDRGCVETGSLTVAVL
jgi:hypothetical protein